MMATTTSGNAATGTGEPKEQIPEATAMVLSNKEAALDSYRKGLEPRDIQEAMKLCAVIAVTGMFGVTTPEDAFVRLAFGRELGLTAMNSLRAIYVVNNRPGIDATVMLALCLQRRECEYFRPIETTPKIATFIAKRRGDPEQRLSWTIAQAETAGLLGGRDKDGKPTKPKDNWVNYPDNMLRARCIANLARIVFPEAINGMHTPDELDAMPPEPRIARPAPAADDSAKIAEKAREYDATKAGFLARIEACTDATEKKAIRTEIKAAQDTGLLPSPWIDDVIAAYTEKWPAKPKTEAPAATPDPTTSGS